MQTPPDQTPFTPQVLYQQFLEIFLTGESLQNFLIYVCNATPPDNSDPITNTIVSVLSSPISLSFSEVGVRAFKTTNVATLPYYLLNAKQGAWVRKVVGYFTRGDIPTSVTSGSDGGFMLRFSPPSTPLLVDKQEVSNALANMIVGSSGYGDSDVKNKIVFILYQRITAHSTMPIPRILSA